MSQQVSLHPIQFRAPGSHQIEGLDQFAHLLWSLHVKSGMKLPLTHTEQFPSQLLQGPAHTSGMEVGPQDRHNDTSEAQPSHRASGHHRLVTRHHGFTGGHLLTQAYKFIEAEGDFVTEPSLFPLPGALWGERSG